MLLIDVQDSNTNSVLFNNKYKIEWEKDFDIVLLENKLDFHLYEDDDLVYKQTFYENENEYFSDCSEIICYIKDIFYKMSQTEKEYHNLYLNLETLIRLIDIQNKYSFFDLYDFLDHNSQVIYLNNNDFYIIKKNKDNKILLNAFYEEDNRSLNLFNELSFKKDIESKDLLELLMTYKSYNSIKIKDLRGFYDSVKDRKEMLHRLSLTVDKFSKSLLFYL